MFVFNNAASGVPEELRGTASIAREFRVAVEFCVEPAQHTNPNIARRSVFQASHHFGIQLDCSKLKRAEQCVEQNYIKTEEHVVLFRLLFDKRSGAVVQRINNETRAEQRSQKEVGIAL